MSLTSCCPYCDYKYTTRLPRRIPIINSPLAAWWAGVWVGRHYSRNHPLEYRLFIHGDIEELIRWYFAQPYLPVKDRYEDMDEEEAINEIVSLIRTGQSTADDIIPPDS